ncbi:hypothetical protein [Nodosilinea sp. E11]|uniref:hypothetical protein n=1 Tax=Nodosilinea sp. E11 TaxID=3037479 RepID=UPI002934E816|nr:hypothetical protein [Nodosilinea sp. E11]WOD40353.1 hypothetical protein RRF56_06045 [Nodosilinea sp. E11]
MADPLFWLALSFLLVVVSLTAVLVVAIPALRELGRAARSAEKMFDTLGRELPPTLEAIRLTGLEITELTDDLTDGVQSAGQVVQQVNQSVTSAQVGAQRLNTSTKSLLAGAKAAWQTWTGEPPARPKRSKPKRFSSAPANADPSSFRPSPEAALGDRQSAETTPSPAEPETNGEGGSDRPQLEPTSLHAAPEAGLVSPGPDDLPQFLPKQPIQGDY